MFKLSIIIPIFNTERYIEECLMSVLNQMDDSIQIICVNDGTPDNAMSIVKRLAMHYRTSNQEQFKIIDQENKGLSNARNAGINLASGKYIGFLDSDDKLEPDYFISLLKVIDASNYDIVDFNLIKSDGNLIKTRDKSFNSLFSLMNWYSPARIYKKTLFANRRFTPNLLYEDLDLTPILYIESKGSFHIDKALYWYRTNEEGITRSFSYENNVKTANSLESILNKYLNLFNENKNQYYAMVAVHSYYLLCISTCRRFGLKKALDFINKYDYQIKSSISFDHLPIDPKAFDSKTKYFFFKPRLYCSAYIVFDKARAKLKSS